VINSYPLGNYSKTIIAPKKGLSVIVRGYQGGNGRGEAGGSNISFVAGRIFVPASRIMRRLCL